MASIPEIVAAARKAYTLDDFEASLLELKSIIDQDEAPAWARGRAARDAGAILRMLGRGDEAREMREKAEPHFRACTTAKGALAADFLQHGYLLLTHLNDAPGATKVLEQGRAAFPEDPELSLALLRAWKFDTGEEANRAHWRGHKLSRELERELPQTPEGPVRDFRMGRLYYSMGDLKRAQARLTAVVENKTQSKEQDREAGGDPVSPARRLLIRLCLETGDYPLAEHFAETEIAAAPHDPAPRLQLARAFLRAYNLDQAAAEYEKLAVRDPEQWEAWAGLGQVQIALGEEGLDTYSRAAQLFTRALTSSVPDDASRRALLYARAYAHAGVFKRDPVSGYDSLRRAYDDLRECIRRDPNQEDSRIALRTVRARMGYTRGLENLKQWGPPAASLLSLLIFVFAQAWLFLDVSAKSLSVPAYIILTLGSLGSGLTGLFLAGLNRGRPTELPLTAPALRESKSNESPEETEPPWSEPLFQTQR